MTTYEKIKELCEKEGFSISSISQKIPGLSISKASITGWKNGSKPRPDKIKAIADYFGVTPEYLLGWSQDEYGSTTEPKKTKISPDEAILLQEYRKYPIDEKQNIIGVVRNWDKIKSFFVK